MWKHSQRYDFLSTAVELAGQIAARGLRFGWAALFIGGRFRPCMAGARDGLFQIWNNDSRYSQLVCEATSGESTVSGMIVWSVPTCGPRALLDLNFERRICQGWKGDVRPQFSDHLF